MCDPSRGPSLNILSCRHCGEESEVFTDEEYFECEGCGREIANPHFHEQVSCSR